VKPAHLHTGLIVSLGLHALLVLFYLNTNLKPPVQPEGSPLELSLNMFQAMSAAPSFAQPAAAEPVELPKDAQPQPQKTRAPQTVANTPPPPVTPRESVTRTQPEQVEAIQSRTESMEEEQAEPETETAPSPQSAELAAAESSAQEQAAMGTRNSEQRDIELQRYNLELLAAIERAKHYPNRARRRNQEGTVMVAFIIDLRGVISDIHILESSGHRTLDKAATDAILRIGQFKPIPESIGLSKMEFRVPINYELAR
jgi:protein TonB